MIQEDSVPGHISEYTVLLHKQCATPFPSLCFLFFSMVIVIKRNFMEVILQHVLNTFRPRLDMKLLENTKSVLLGDDQYVLKRFIMHIHSVNDHIKQWLIISISQLDSLAVYSTNAQMLTLLLLALTYHCPLSVNQANVTAELIFMTQAAPGTVDRATDRK